MNDNRLLNGIIEKAKIDAEEIILRAAKTVVEKNNAYASAVIRIKKETENNISVKISEIEKRTDSAVKAEKRRASLKNREIANSEVRELFLQKIKGMIGTPEYNEFLAKLIAEGAVSINDSEVSVTCSFREDLSDTVLIAAGKHIKDYTGKDVKLKRSSSTALSRQGIIVESRNGRITYNNQIDSRLRRFDEDIKMIIIKGLKKE